MQLSQSYAQLPGMFYQSLAPTPVTSPELLLWNDELAQALNMDFTGLDALQKAQFFSGNRLFPGSQPLSQAYSGHQFGHFTHLGDGRAHLLGEYEDMQGRRWDIQLKGSGRTRYSRNGDGRAALGPVLREYIISEAMAALGVPTTRGLAVVASGEPVYREEVLPGAILTRVARCHIRVGTFQFALAQGDIEALRALFDYSVQRLAPQCVESECPPLAFLQWVQDQQAALVARWLLLGFIHGVMNTDNMAISGETIDYGPCAFLDVYQPDTVFSSIDRQGRYRYSHQGTIAHWNLTRFAETLLPLIDADGGRAAEMATQTLAGFPGELHEQWLGGMCRKLGWETPESDDAQLIGQWLQLLEKHEQDFTNSFFALGNEEERDREFFQAQAVQQWLGKREQRIERAALKRGESAHILSLSNPAVIPRNHRVEQALKLAEAEGDMSLVHRLLAVVKSPYSVADQDREYQQLPSPQERVYQTFCGT